ncbi:hypothetical protein PTKIN_Ptkin19aG0053100 [Pterospermum kingtungense]
MGSLSRFVVKDYNLHTYDAVCTRRPLSLVPAKRLQTAHLAVYFLCFTMGSLSRFVVKDYNLHTYDAVCTRRPLSLVPAKRLQTAHLDVRARISVPGNGKVWAI